MFKNIDLDKHFLAIESYCDTDLDRINEQTEEMARKHENTAKSNISLEIAKGIYNTFTVTKSVFENENRLTYGMDVMVTTKSELAKFLTKFKEKVLSGEV